MFVIRNKNITTFALGETEVNSKSSKVTKLGQWSPGFFQIGLDSKLKNAQRVNCSCEAVMKLHINAKHIMTIFSS